MGGNDISTTDGGVPCIRNTAVFVIYCASSGISLFSLLVLRRILYTDIIDYLIALNIVSFLCAAICAKRYLVISFIVLLIGALTPSFYYSPYMNYRETDAKRFSSLKDSRVDYRFFESGENNNFLLIGRTGASSYVCYGPYKTNMTECSRIASGIFVP